MMYFNFNIQDCSTDEIKTFIKLLSNLFEELSPPLVDTEKIKIVESGLECIQVTIPHKTRKNLCLTIEYDGVDALVVIAHGNFHFQEYSDEKECIHDTLKLVAKILQDNIEIHTYYRGNKVVRIRPYLVNKDGEKEYVQSSVHNISTVLNPFLKRRKEIETGSFFN